MPNDETPSPAESGSPKPMPYHEHITRFVQALGEALTSAYQQIKRPEIQKYKDGLYMGAMVELGALKKALGARSSEEEGLGKHTERLGQDEAQKVFFEQVSSDLMQLMKVAQKLNDTTSVINTQMKETLHLTTDIGELFQALARNFSARTHDEPPAPLTARQEELMGELWGRYSGIIDQEDIMKNYERIVGTVGELTRETLELRKQEVQELATVNAATLANAEVSLEMANAIGCITDVHKAIMMFVGNYLGVSQGKAQEPPPLPD